jgi:hypothetical protein
MQMQRDSVQYHINSPPRPAMLHGPYELEISKHLFDPILPFLRNHFNHKSFQERSRKQAKITPKWQNRGGKLKKVINTNFGGSMTRAKQERLASFINSVLDKHPSQNTVGSKGFFLS